MRYLLNNILIMTITGSVVILIFKIFEPITKRYFSAAWHYGVLKCVALFFCIPIGKLFSVIYSTFLPSGISRMTSSATSLMKDIGIRKNIFNSRYFNSITAEHIAAFLVGVWILGFLLLLLLHSISYVKFRCTIMKNKSLANKRLHTIAEQYAGQFRIKRPIRLYVNEFIDTPMLIGLFSPIILLPTDKLDEQNAVHILSHELIHYKNKDLIIKISMLFVRTFYWFNPFVYLLFKELDKWCEYTCDEKNVLHLAHEIRKQYGRVILDTISTMPSYGSTFASPFLLPKQKIKERLMFMINVRKMRLRTKIASAMIAVALMGFGMTTAFAADIEYNSLISQDNSSNQTYNSNDDKYSDINLNDNLNTSTMDRQEKLSEFANTNKP